MFVFLDPRPLSSALGPSALGPHLVDPRPQNIARLNTILLFNFEVFITLLKQVFFLFVLIIKDVTSKKLQNN